jgi:SAM-dependent methyltransferase
MTTTTVFATYSQYYDLLYQEKNYTAEVAYIDSLLNRYNIPGRELLEFGSGTGKHGRLLAELGYSVTGIERSAEMVDISTVTSGFNCQQGDICTVHLNRSFDAVISLFHVVSYQVSNEALRAVIARASEHLKPGGLFVFDVWYSPAVYSQRPAVRVKRIVKDERVITRIAEPTEFPNENRIDVQYTVFAQDLNAGAFQTFSETHPMRHFSLPELKMLAELNGFDLLTAEEFLTGNKPGVDTWGVCLVLRRI